MEERASERTLLADAGHMLRGTVAVEVPQHQGRGDGGYAVGCGNADPHTVGAPQFGEDEQERHEEHQLAAHREEYALFSHADALEEVAHHNLKAHNGRHDHDDFHTRHSEVGQGRVVGEEGYGVVGQELAQDEGAAHDDGGEDDGLAQHLIHPLRLLCPKVETGDGLHALTDAHHHHDEEERDAVHDAIGCNGQVAPVLGQSLVDEDDHQTGTQLHTERRETNAENVLHNALPESVDA